MIEPKNSTPSGKQNAKRSGTTGKMISGKSTSIYDASSLVGEGRLTRRLLQTREAERRAASRDLHDVTGQSLTILRLVIDKACYCSAQELTEVLSEAVSLIDEAAERVRRVSRRLRPGILDLNLIAALEWLLEELHSRTGITATFQHRGSGENISQEISTAIYRIVQIALVDVGVNVDSPKITLKLTALKNRVSVNITVPGCGFERTTLDDDKASDMLEMEQWASIGNGQLHIENSQRNEVLISAVFPKIQLQIS